MCDPLWIRTRVSFEPGGGPPAIATPKKATVAHCEKPIA